MSFIQQIIEIKNLYWAWEKAKWFFKPGDIWFDELEVAAFEANLQNELVSIQNDIQNGVYKLKPIFPVAFPKSKDKKDGARTRQTFWVSVRDQVTWLAVANILGRELDSEMPFWSYGNRLYISTFYEDNTVTGKSELKFGYYRNTTKHTFRKWTQSWPLYRRHINLTAKLMCAKKRSIELELDERESELITVNSRLDNEHPLKVRYLEKDYWNKPLTGELYWASLDLKNFYPELNLQTIKSNIINYMPYADQGFNELLNSLLSFKIDFEGWTTEEIEKIKVKPEENYDHMPTGLFVAGFLANIAMLKVDEIIHDKISKQRNIAHFRFVDDHVILANSFDDLVAWITEYEALIKSQEIGAIFNSDKTQPAELAEYIKKKGHSDIDENTLAQVKKACELDPEFLSPLMTQTLAKVSKIVGTEFQLLNPDEERSLIADIEHLLITEFPDHELRRDTRVSFAARMLSTLVPQITINIEKAYNLHNKKLELNRVRERQIQKKENTQVIDEEIRLITAQLVYEEKKIADEENSIANRTLKLLLKAVRENHEKVRLWTRVLEFSFKSGKSDILKVFNEVNNLKDRGETNELSITFIRSLLLQVLSQLLFNAFLVISNERSTYKQRRRSLNFLNDVFTADVFTYFEASINIESKFYEKNSYDMFKFSAGTVIYLLKDKNDLKETKTLVRDFNLIDWSNDPISFCNSTKYPFGTWAWWIINKLSLRSNNKSQPYLWNEISPYLKGSDVIDRSIIQLFPKLLSETLLMEVENNKPDFVNNEGWLFDVYHGIIEKGRETSGYSFIDKIQTKSQSTLKDHISLYEWIKWTKDRDLEIKNNYKDRPIFDPRLSEWMALEIIKKMAIAIREKSENVSIEDFLSEGLDYSICIHPNNFKLPKGWIENSLLTWEELRGLVDHNHSYITLRAKENLIYDRRFTPSYGVAMLYRSNEENNSIISALGALLICLLRKSSDLPARWNPIGHQQVWLNLAKSELRDVPISSFTRNIIDGCFSNRNFETAIFTQMEVKKGMEFKNDSFLDPPYLTDISDFIKYVSSSQKQLEKQQLSVSEHQPRQLIPISLKQLRRSNYQDLTEE